MHWLLDSFEAIRGFMELGGPILNWIAFTIFIMWVLIIERLMFFRTRMKTLSAEIHERWEARKERRTNPGTASRGRGSSWPAPASSWWRR